MKTAAIATIVAGLTWTINPAPGTPPAQHGKAYVNPQPREVSGGDRCRTTTPGNMDGDHDVDLCDFVTFVGCYNVSPISADCLCADTDGSGTVDMVDFLSFAASYATIEPIVMRDRFGNPLLPDSTVPYSPRQTCGAVGCHDVDHIANGFLKQRGRTDLSGNVIMTDDYYGDGREWIKSPGLYGTWGQSFRFQLAAKQSTHPSQIEQGAFAWIRDCAACHAGGAMGEYDRDGLLLYDEVTGEFGYEQLGKTAADVVFDGDYLDMDYATGQVTQAPWDVTGLMEPDCLYCHRRERTITRSSPQEREAQNRDGFRSARGDMNYAWRAGILAAAGALTDNLGDPVPAFAAASTAGQGWFSNIETGTATPKLQIDYSVGLVEGSLTTAPGGFLALADEALARPPRDRACTSCHPLGTITGTTWYDSRDIHYAKLNNLNDEDSTNDVAPADSTACNFCHPGNIDHNFAKGNSMQVQFRNEIDYANMRTCRDCHNADSPVRHPDAPEVPGEVTIHLAPMYETLSCQACHIPYALTSAVLFRDITIPGAVGTTAQYYSADPQDPTDPDKSTWYPAFRYKVDTDGVERVFPYNRWINIYFGDWDQNGTPADLSDDVISPIKVWRVAQVVGPTPLPVVTDDNGDGQMEINRPEELLAYFAVLKNNDAHGTPVALNPVMVRGINVWYEDPGAPDGVNSFDHRGTGIPITAYPYLWEMDHNVLAKEESWGYDPSLVGCNQCHTQLGSPVLDRLVLVDPYGLDGQPVYETVRQQTGLNPP